MEVLNFFHKVFFLAFFTAQFSYLVTSQDVFSLIRNPPGDGVQWNDLDYFQLPESKCNTAYCSEYSAYSDSALPCHCKCTFTKATFGFYSGSWTCLSNNEVRTLSDCRYKFADELDRYPLKILEQDQQYNAFFPSTGCSVDLLSSRYFTCDGRWTAISQSPSFTIRYRRKLLFTRSHYKYEVKIGSGDDLVGRIISLGIKCSRQSSCLLFKLEGTLQCMENFTSTTMATVPNSNNAGGQSASASSASSASSSSSGTAAVVVTIILAIIMATIIGFVIWKKKRGENVWIVDRVGNIVGRKGRPSIKEEPHEQIYAEIPDQTTHSPIGANNNILLATVSGTVTTEEELPTDDDGYAIPTESPYLVLENPNDSDVTRTLENTSQQEHSSVAVVPSVTVSESSGVVDNKRYEIKERRRPPSPPRKGDDTKKGQHDLSNGHDGNDENEQGERESDKNYDYESLKEDRAMYQPLDRNTMDK